MPRHERATTAAALMAADRHAAAAAIAEALEAELKRLERWSAQAPSAEAFENMGAFGQRTLAFEQWLQFVLLRRLREIVAARGAFPSGSQVATYAVRELDGDPEAEGLIGILRDLDNLVEGTPAAEADPGRAAPPDAIRLGDTRLPAVVYTLIEVLPQFEGEALEAQLESYDTFLDVLSPVVRPELSALLLKAAAVTADPASRARIERAAHAVARGKRAAGG